MQVIWCVETITIWGQVKLCIVNRVCESAMNRIVLTFIGGP